MTFLKNSSFLVTKLFWHQHFFFCFFITFLLLTWLFTMSNQTPLDLSDEELLLQAMFGEPPVVEEINNNPKLVVTTTTSSSVTQQSEEKKVSSPAKVWNMSVSIAFACSVLFCVCLSHRNWKNNKKQLFSSFAPDHIHHHWLSVHKLRKIRLNYCKIWKGSTLLRIYFQEKIKILRITMKKIYYHRNT